METLAKCLIAAALTLPMPNAYAETQAASNMITAAAAISLYKIHCRGEIPAATVERINAAVREYGESRVVASMVEMGLQREKLGHAAFCVHGKKSISKNKARLSPARVGCSRQRTPRPSSVRTLP